MSGGVSHQVLDRLVKFEAIINGKVATQNKVVSEIITKHNDLAAGLAALEQLIKQTAGFTAAELGKIAGTTESNIKQLNRSIYGVDHNVLALSELLKEVVGQLVRSNTILEKAGILPAQNLTEEENEKVQAESTTWYKELVKGAFVAARAQMEKQEAEARAKDEKEAADAKANAEAFEAAEQAKSEKNTVEAELKAASDAERSIVTTASGGPGSAFPEGADIFGG